MNLKLNIDKEPEITYREESPVNVTFFLYIKHEELEINYSVVLCSRDGVVRN